MERHDAQDLLDRLHRAQNEYYAGGDGHRLEILLTPDVRWSVPGESRLAGVYHGIPDVLGYMRRRRRITGCTLRLVRRDVLTGRGNRIAAMTDGVALRSGSVHTWEAVSIYDVDGGRIRRCWLLPLDVAAFDAIWS